MAVLAVPDVLMFVVPVTVRPPLPWSKPVVAFTPTAVNDPSAVMLATPAPPLVTAKVVLAPSTKSNVVVPAAVLCIVVSEAASCNTLLAESSTKAPAPPELMVSAPPAVSEVDVPRLTVPDPPWMVRLPAVVDQVAAAAEVRVNAPVVVCKLEAALPVRETAPLD